MTARSEKWRQAGSDIADLERTLQTAYSQIAVQLTDQWAAGVRDEFEQLDAGIATSHRARAAFAGAYIVTSILIDNLPLPQDRLEKVCYLLRYLYDKGDADVDLWDLPDLNA